MDAVNSLYWLDAGFEVTPLEYHGASARVHTLSFDNTTQLWTKVADADWEGSAIVPLKSLYFIQE